MDATSKGPIGVISAKLPLIGRAVAEALTKLTHDPDRTAFLLIVFDTETQDYAWTSDGQREAMMAALSEFLSKQSH